jgi:predicted nucleic acid-binding protein
VIVVADTSPLNYLIRLGHPDILGQIYGRVLVPRAVLIEMQHPQALVEMRAWVVAPPTWLGPHQAETIDASLPAALGAGEREAISLALEKKADVLLIDERAGRHEAQMRHLEVAGTLAVLLQASLRRCLDLHEAIRQLRHYGFRVSQGVEAVTLARYEQARNKAEHDFDPGSSTAP